MKTLSADTTKRKNRKTGETPLWILKCPFPSTGTIYLSDQVVSVPTLDSGIITKSWIAQWGSIDENISNSFSSSLVADFSLQVFIDQKSQTTIETILWTAANNIEVTDCELYLWFYGSTDAPVKLWTGNIVDFRKVSDMAYELQFSDQGTKFNKYIGTLTNKTDFPNIYDGNCGKVLPIIYGNVPHTPAIAVKDDAPNNYNADLLFAVADHAVRSIDVVYVDGTAITDGVTKYPSGTTGCAGKACVKLTHGVKKTTVTVKPSTSSGWVNAANSIDGNDGSYAYTNGNGNTHTVGFDYSGIKGQIISKLIHIKVRAAAGSNTRAWITCNGIEVVDAPSQTYGSDVTRDVWISASAGLSFVFNVSGGNGGYGYIYEVYGSEVTCYDYNLAGKCASEVIVNGTVTAEVTGYVSDGSQSEAFGPNGSLIERPDLILKHLAYIRLGLPVANFTTNAASSFVTNQYRFAGALTEYQTIRHWAEKIAWESRCYVRWYAGNLHMIWRPDALTSQKTITGNMIREGSISVERTPLDEVINTVDAQASRIWNRSGDDAYQWYYSNSDSASIARYGKKEAPGKFNYDFMFGVGETGDDYGQLSNWVIRGATTGNTDNYRLYWSYGTNGVDSVVVYLYKDAGRTQMVAYGARLIALGLGPMTIQEYVYSGITGSVDITAFVTPDSGMLLLPGNNAPAKHTTDFYLARNKDRKRLITFDCFLDNMELEFGDAITIAPLGNLLCEVQKVNFKPGSAKSNRNDMITIVAREY